MRQIVPATLHQAIAAIEAANKLNPTEPRFLRLLAEAYLQLGGDEGRDGAIERWCASPSGQCRRIRRLICPAHRSQNMLRSKQPTSESKRSTGCWRDKRFPRPKFKSHIALMSAKSWPMSAPRIHAAAKQYVDQALQWMPLNPEAAGDSNSGRSIGTARRCSASPCFCKCSAPTPRSPASCSNWARTRPRGMVDQSLNWVSQRLRFEVHLGICVPIRRWFRTLLTRPSCSSQISRRRRRPRRRSFSTRIHPTSRRRFSRCWSISALVRIRPRGPSIRPDRRCWLGSAGSAALIRGVEHRRCDAANHRARHGLRRRCQKAPRFFEHFRQGVLRILAGRPGVAGDLLQRQDRRCAAVSDSVAPASSRPTA